jgi:hypothetical protein
MIQESEIYIQGAGQVTIVKKTITLLNCQKFENTGTSPGSFISRLYHIKRKLPKTIIAQFSGWTVCRVGTNRFFYLE